MTTFILAGGNDRRADPQYGARLARVITGIIEKPVILSSFLSRPEAEQHEHWLDYLPWFKQHFGDDAIVLEATKDNFYDLAKEADVIYMHGGRTQELFNNLPDFEKSRRAFREKIVVGSSAGANYLSTYCVSMSEGLNIVQGSGIVGHSVIVHYRTDNFEGTKYSQSDWAGVEKELLAMMGDHDLVCLPEGQFCIIVR